MHRVAGPFSTKTPSLSQPLPNLRPMIKKPSYVCSLYYCLVINPLYVCVHTS